MLRIIDRYLLRELTRSFVAVNAVLLLVTFGGVLTDVLNKIARGKLPASLLLAQVGLRSLDAVAIILPLGLFLTVLLAYGRLYRDSEVAVLAASGLRLRDMLKPVLWLAVPLLVALAGITFVASPRALALADKLVQDANRSLLVAGLEAGRFVDLPGGLGVIYIGRMSADGLHLLAPVRAVRERGATRHRHRGEGRVVQRPRRPRTLPGDERWPGMRPAARSSRRQMRRADTPCASGKRADHRCWRDWCAIEQGR